MFPLKDDNPTELTPYITTALILINVAVWIYVQGAGFSEDVLAQSICRFGTIPAELTGGTGGYDAIRLGPGQMCEFGGLRWTTLFTGIFLHGSWLHLIGNMWFLWLFGNNIEDSMGHLQFIVFYLLTGLAADGAHIAAAAGSVIPTVGASGAISGVMGAYLVLYPRVKVQTLFVILIFIRIFPVPAWLVLGEWFLIQLWQGSVTEVGTGGGVAFWAHIGGFVAGMALIKFFDNEKLVEAKRHKVKLRPSEIDNGGWW